VPFTLPVLTYLAITCLKVTVYIAIAVTLPLPTPVDYHLPYLTLPDWLVLVPFYLYFRFGLPVAGHSLPAVSPTCLPQFRSNRLLPTTDCGHYAWTRRLPCRITFTRAVPLLLPTQTLLRLFVLRITADYNSVTLLVTLIAVLTPARVGSALPVVLPRSVPTFTTPGLPFAVTGFATLDYLLWIYLPFVVELRYSAVDLLPFVGLPTGSTTLPPAFTVRSGLPVLPVYYNLVFVVVRLPFTLPDHLPYDSRIPLPSPLHTHEPPRIA